jgi:hypothetical protein
MPVNYSDPDINYSEEPVEDLLERLAKLGQAGVKSPLASYPPEPQEPNASFMPPASFPPQLPPQPEYNPFPRFEEPAPPPARELVDPLDYAASLGQEVAGTGMPVPEPAPTPPPVVPESDKSLGRPLAASPDNVGVVPPPPPTDTPVRLPEGQPEPSVAPPLPPPQRKAAPDPLAKYRRDPNDIIREAYRPALEQAMEAKRKDLARQTSPFRVWDASNMEVAGMLTRNPTMVAEGIKQGAAALYDPVYQGADKAAYEAADAGNKAKFNQMMMDPDSDLAHTVRMSYLNSTTGRKEIAQMKANNPGMTDSEARYRVLSIYENSTPVAMKEAVELQKGAQTVSEGYSREAVNFANADVLRKQYDKLEQEVDNEAVIQKEVNTPGTFASQVIFEALDRMFPGRLTKDMKFGMSGRAMASIVKWTADVVPLLKMRIDNYRKYEADKQIVPGKLEYRVTGVDEQGNPIIPPHDKAKDEILHRNIDQAYYQTAIVKDEIANALTAAGAKTYASPNATVIRKSLQQLDATLASINASEERKEINELIGLLKPDEAGQEKAIAIPLLRPGGRFHVVLDKALATVNRVARDKAAQWSRPDTLDSRPEAPPPKGVAIGFDAVESHIGPATMTRIVDSKNRKHIVMKQTFHNRTFYFKQDGTAMMLGKGDKELPFK